MKQNNKNLTHYSKLLSVYLLALIGIACRPAQKDPPFAYEHNRLDTKVAELQVAKDNPLNKMGVPELWKKSTGKNADGSRVRIALVGTGIDYNIADLRDALWVNTAEVGETTRMNGTDDDENGYIDDVSGYDFFSGDSFPYDWNGHDTFTASVIAATGRTNPQLVGVAPNAELLIARYIGPEGTGKGLDAVEALIYSIKNQAKIIYFNWPSGGFSPSDSKLLLQVFKEAGDRNILIVTPAGNNGNQNVPSFIQQAGALTNVVVVSGTDTDGKIRATSNSGRGLALVAAPSTGVSGYLPGSLISQDLQTTSVAAAYVTGVAALISTLPQMGSVQKIRSVLLGATQEARRNLEQLDVLSAGSLYVAGL